MRIKLQKEESNLTLFLRKFIKCKKGYIPKFMSKELGKDLKKRGLLS